MNLRHIILSVRHYGIVGIWNFIIRQRSERAFRLSLQRTNRTAAPEPGITIIGGFRQPTSLGKVLRDLAILLKKSEIPFVVFFNFDYASSFNRKNPEAILHAFAKSIAQEPNTKILFKTMRAKSHEIHSTRLRQLAKELEIDNRLFTIDDFIPQEDLVNLTNACDVYMSLHRGEGFGLGIAEAMSLGKPVIVTDYSATAEFCNIDNSIPIPYKLLGISPNQLDVDVYHHVTRWAEPDIDAAAVALRKLYDDPKLRRHIGENAKRSIEEHFSTARFKKSIKSFIN